MATYTDSAGILRDGQSVTDTSPSATGVTYEDQRVFDGFGYTVSTAIVAVANGNFLSVELTNPTASGVNYVMTARVFSDNVVGGNAPLEYVRYSSAAALPGAPTTVTIGNRIQVGQAAPTGATFRYVTNASAPTGGTTSSSGFIPTNGEEKRIKDIVIIPPGGKLIYSIGGSGGGLAAAARIAVTFLFFTRAV